MLSLKEYLDTTECECGGPVLKFMNSSNGSRIIKCGYTTEDYDVKKKQMVKSKHPPCNFIKKSEENDIVPEINNIIQTPQLEKEDIKSTLKLLFTYLLGSRKRNTLQEINNIVRDKLSRKINRNYLDSDKLESYEEYYSRIFSREIIIKPPIIITKPKTEYYPVIRNKILESIIKSRNNTITNTLDSDYSSDYSSDSDSLSDPDSDKETESEIVPDNIIENDFIEDFEDLGIGSDYSDY